MPLRGTFRSSPLPEILQLLTNSRQTGILRVHDDDDTKLLAFHQGQLTYVVHQRPFPRLKDLVVHRGLAREADVSGSYEERYRWDNVVSRTHARRKLSSGQIPPGGERRANRRLLEKDWSGRLRSILLAQGRLTEEELEAATATEAIPDSLLEGILKGAGLLRPVEIHDAKRDADEERSLLQSVIDQGLLTESDVGEAIATMSDETLAELLVYQGRLSRAEARRFLSQLKALRAQIVPTIRLGEYLVTKGKVTQRQLERALEEQLVTNERLGQILVEHEIISSEEATKAKDEIVALREDFGPLYALRQKLAERHSVSDEEFSEALNEYRRTGGTLIAALEAAGKVSAEETKSAVKGVVIDEICDLLTWSDASFEFFDDFSLTDLFERRDFPAVQADLGQDTEMQVVSLLLRAHSILDEEHHAGLDEFSLSTVFTTMEPSPPAHGASQTTQVRRVTREESDRRLTHRNVLRSLEGRHSLREIRRVLPGNRASHFRLFAELVADGLIRPLTRSEAFECGKKALSQNLGSEALVLFRHALESPGDDPSNSRLRSSVNDARWSVERHLLRRLISSTKNVFSAIAESPAATRISEWVNGLERLVRVKKWMNRGWDFIRKKRRALERWQLVFDEFLIRTGWARHLWALKTHTFEPFKDFLERHAWFRLAFGFGVFYIILQSCLLFLWPGSENSPPAIASTTTPSIAETPMTEHRSPISFQTGGPVHVPATVQGAQIYFASRDGTLRSVAYEDAAVSDPSAEPLKLLWKLKIGEFGDLFSPPVIADDRLFLTNVRGTVFAASRDGEIAWKTHLPRCEPITPTPLLRNESKLVGLAVVSRENVYVLSSDDGRILYRLQTGDQIFARPAGDADTLIVGSGDDYIYRVAWRRGKSLWEHDATDEVTGLVWTDGVVVFTTRDGRLAALDGVSGKELWTRSFPRNSIRRIERSESGPLWVETSQGELSSVAVDSGKTLSTFIADSGFNVSQTYVHENRFYYAARDGHLGVIDPQGVLRWRTREPVGQVTGLAYGKDFLVVSVRDGSLVLLPYELAEGDTGSKL